MTFPPDAARAWFFFGGGLGGYSGVHAHPNGHDVVVFADGAADVVDPESRRVKEELSFAVAGVYEVQDPPGLICDEQGLRFFRVGPTGIVWRTRRLSLDGFEDVVLRHGKIIGRGLTFDYETMAAFEVDLRTGRATGGLISPLEEDRREHLADL